MAKNREPRNQVLADGGPQRIPQHRIAGYVFLGTLGSIICEELAERHPELKSQLLAIETAKPPSEGETKIEIPDWMILLDEVNVGRMARSRTFPLLDDGLAPGLLYPQSVQNGASEVRLFSTIKFAGKITALRKRLREIIVEALRNSKGQPLLILLFSSLSGGTGSALIMMIAYLIRDEARRASPGATVEINVHGVLPSFFHASEEVQQSDLERVRLDANTATTLREIKYLQSPENGRALQVALGITPRSEGEVPPINSLALYGSESSGGTLSTEAMVERLVAAALTVTHPGVAEFDRNHEGNAAAQYWGAFGMAEHAIVKAEAVRSVWLPPAVRMLYKQTLLTEAIDSSVRKSETEQIDGLMLSFKARLGLDGIEVGIQQTLDEPTLSKKVTVDPRIGKMSCRDATTHLIGIHQYFKSEVMPPLLAKTRAKARELELTLIPEATNRAYAQILSETSGLDQAREVCEALMREFNEGGNNIAARRGELKQADLSGRFQLAVERLKKGSIVHGRSLRMKAGKSCDAWKWGKKEDLVLQLKERAYRLAAQRFQGYALEIGDRMASLRERLGQAKVLKAEARRASSKGTDTLRSIIREDEVEKFLQDLIHGVEVALGASKKLLTPTTLMEPGLGELLAEFEAECGHRYDEFIHGHLRSLSGVTAFGRLRFDLSSWVSEAAGKLALPVSLDLLPIGGEGNAAIKQYIAAGGEESRILARVKSTNQKLRGYRIVDIGDPFLVTVRQSYAGLPMQCIPATDYVAAAKAFEAKDQSLAINVLSSSGFVLDARYEDLNNQGLETSVMDSRRTVGGMSLTRSNGQPLPERLVTES